MRRFLPLLLVLAGAVAAAPFATAATARAVDFTRVMSALPLQSRTFAPDSAAPPESTTFVQFLSVCPGHDCGSGRPICVTDSITATVGGSLPSNCYRIRDLFLYYPPILSIRPFAPWVVVVIDDGACLGRPCVGGRYPWSGQVTMPPLPEGPYSLDVAVIRVSCADSVPPPPSPLLHMPFAVVRCDSIPPSYGCLSGDWRHLSVGTNTGGCDATIGPGGAAQLVFALHTDTPVAALQGSFVLDPSVLRVTAIEPAGDAQGYRLTWSPTANGANFILFNDGGVPIPPDSLNGPGRPILLVTVTAPAGAMVPAETRLVALHPVGSDPAGGLVPECIVGGPDGFPKPPPFARICGMADCDANHDGRTDVRDLVLMVRCLRAGAACTTVFDCQRDGAFTLDDILCCAWRILHVAPCANPFDCAPDSTRPGQPLGVGVEVGLPVEVAGEVRVPIHIAGADHVGAARLAMRFPADRWRIAGLDATDAAWLTLVDAQADEAIMGAIRIGDAPAAGGLDLTLRLAPLGDAAAGGELGSLSADLSATDGVKLVTPVVAPVRPLPGSPSVELSENRPDPFAGETRFTLSLPAAAAVDLGVFDLNGRRVASLHHGALAAGVSEFAWNGRGDGGARLGAGVYFYRAVTGGRAVSRRMVFLGGN